MTIGRYYLGFSWWTLLTAAAAAVLVSGGLYLGWRYWEQRKALRQQQEIARQERDASLGRGDKGNLQDIRKKWAEVVRSLKESNLQRRGDDPIYALPWFVVIGESGGGKSALIRESHPQSSVVTAGQDGATSNCDWWFFDKLIVLDTAGRYVFQAPDSDCAGEWWELLKLLRNNRRREPVNGVIVALPADSLTKNEAELKEPAAQLRHRLDEMVQRLGFKFPVYLAITKSDLITGFKQFFGALPPGVNTQASGYINAENANNADAGRFFEKAFGTICERTECLRLALIQNEERDHRARETFLFPAELRSLHAPLKAFVEVLFRPSPYRDAPFFRGLFLTSACQAGSPSSHLSRLLGLNYTHKEKFGAPRDHFLRDFFSLILPNDRGLTRRTSIGHERYQLKQAAGFVITAAVSLFLCGLFTLSFAKNSAALKQVEREMTPCLDGGVNTVMPALRTLNDCRQTIVRLIPHSTWQKTTMSFGLGHWHSVATGLQRRFVTAFSDKVLKPLNETLDQTFASQSANPMLVGSVIQRVQLLALCRTSGCRDPEQSDEINYAAMLATAEPQLKNDNPAIDRLRQTHEAYLLWQIDPNRFAEMESKDLARITRWLNAGGLTEERILESAMTQFPAIRASEFWGFNVPGQIDPAYTSKAWREGINPLISGLKKVKTEAADVRELVSKFEVNYRERASRQWEEFLKQFPDGERGAGQKGLSREITLNIGRPEFPYDHVIETAHANLTVILGESWQRDEIQPWVATLKKYVALKAKIGSQTNAKQGSAESVQAKDAEALKYLTLYLNSLSQFRSELSTTEKSFSSSKKAFEEGEASGNATHPVLKASWALGMLRDTIGSRQGEDRVFWLILTRPVVLGWKALLNESGKYLQQQWEGLLFEIKDLDEGPKNGKIIAFVNGSASAFLSREGRRWAPRRLLDQSVPFSDPFVQYLSTVTTVIPPNGSGKELPLYIARIS